MENEATQSANSIIADALAKAGVTPSNIELPSEAEQSKPTEEQPGRPNLDGSLKGEVKGESLEDKEADIETPEATAEKPSEPASEAKAEQPLSKADIETLVNQGSANIQSLMDRKLNQLNLQMQQTVGALNQFFQTQEESSIAGLPTEEQVLKRLDRLEKGGAQLPKIPTQSLGEPEAGMIPTLKLFVDAAGLKADDSRIDWATDTNDPKVGLARFLGSVKKALMENQTAEIAKLKGDGEKEIQKLRKKTGVDKVSTSGPSGAGLPDISKLTSLQKLELGYRLNEEAARA